MKLLLTITRQGSALSFNSDGSVTDSKNTPAGTWIATSDQTWTGLTYRPAGAPTEKINAKYSINTNNQLVVAIPAQGNIAASQPKEIEGYIAVTDAMDFAYYAIEDDDPTTPAAGFYVSGPIAIDPSTNIMTVNGSAGTALKITGFIENGNTALAVDQADGGLDLIEFSAMTHNPLANGGAVDIPAQISITGRWDIHDGDIKFGVHYATDGTTPTLAIAIAGEINGVAAGFEFSSKGAKSQVLFTIAGKINGTGNDGNWSLSLGYANNQLTAVGNVKDTIVMPDGTITLAGSFTVTKGNGALKFDVNLAATWTLANGQLSIAVSGNNGTYTLSLSGDLKIGPNWEVNFKVSAGTNGSPEFSISVGTAQPNSALNTQLKLYFSGNKLQLSINLTVSLQYVNGMLLPKPAPAAPAPAAAALAAPAGAAKVAP